jgi:hypothetical protein
MTTRTAAEAGPGHFLHRYLPFATIVTILATAIAPVQVGAAHATSSAGASGHSAKGSILGKLVTVSGRALIHGHVIAYRHVRREEFKGSGLFVKARTNGHGRFDLTGVRPGMWFVYAAAPDNRFAWHKVRVGHSPVHIGKLVASHRGFELSGQAPDDQAVLWGRVFYKTVLFDGTSTVQMNAARKRPRYHLHSVPAGRYRLIASCPEGGVEINRTITIHRNRVIDLGGRPCN